MKIFLLEPRDGIKELIYPANPWDPWFDKAFGFVVVAENEAQARLLAAEKAGDEEERAWLDGDTSSCEELTPEGPARVVITNFASA